MLGRLGSEGRASEAPASGEVSEAVLTAVLAVPAPLSGLTPAPEGPLAPEHQPEAGRPAELEPSAPKLASIAPAPEVTHRRAVQGLEVPACAQHPSLSDQQIGRASSLALPHYVPSQHHIAAYV